MTNDINYTFSCSQPLTQQQLDYLDNCLQNLPYQDSEYMLDVPEYTTLIELVQE